MFTASVDFSGFRQAVKRTQDIIQLGIGDAVRHAAQEGAAEAKRLAPIGQRTEGRTPGQLRAGITARFLSSNGRGVQWEILSIAPYSRYVEGGTKPHRIEPRNASMLRFVVGGDVVFAHGVNHPGTRPIPFAGPGYHKAERVLRRDLELMVVKAQEPWR